jgi:sugar/nucleoside kinase (ribokinase family)
MARSFDVMAAGHLCLDMIPSFYDGDGTRIQDILKPGRLVRVGESAVSTGGAVSNTGINMSTLGNKVCYCARVGDDAFGKMTKDVLKGTGNTDGIIEVEDTASSYTVVVAPPNIDRIFLHNPGPNDEFGPEDLNPDLIAQCRLFHFGYPSLMKRMHEHGGRDMRKVFEIARAAGATTSCDISFPDADSPAGQADWLVILEAILPLVDLFLPSIEEMLYMLERETCQELCARGEDLIDVLQPPDYTRLADKLISMGAKVVLLKAGHRGIYARTASAEVFDKMGAAGPGDVGNWSDRELWIPALEAEHFASATGAGDTAIAGFLTAFLRGLSIEESLRFATCCAWQNVQVLDSISGVGSWEATQALLSQHMDVIDPGIDAPGWQWRDNKALWTGPADKVSE